MKVALYARYSSELQNARSIADQLAMAHEHAVRQGWTVVATFTDEAISGASIANRPGLRDLMCRAERREFDVVLTESLDRLSRDLEDTAGLHKRLAFWGIEIVTLADGTVGTMHVGLRGIVGKLYLEDLAQKTRRGQIGRVRAGRIAGGRCYGYDVVRAEEKGQRTINDAEAAIVRGIYEDYAAGVAPRAIVRRLNGAGIPAPRGGLWNASALLGSAQRRNGILNNPLYVGEITYNRQRFIKNPETGKRLSRANGVRDWVVQPVPELAIVPKELYDAAQQRRSHRAGRHLHHQRRPRHLLSGLLECGCCGSRLIVKTRVGRTVYFACSARENRGDCQNTRFVAAHEVEARLLAGLRKLLLAPDLIETAVRVYHEEAERITREQARSRGTIIQQLADADREAQRLVDAIRRGGDMPSLVDALAVLEVRRKDLRERLPSPAPTVIPHPQAALRYRQIVDDLEHQLRGDDPTAARAIEVVRALIARVVITPTPRRQPVTLTLHGNLAALLEIAERGRLRSSSERLQPLSAFELAI